MSTDQPTDGPSSESSDSNCGPDDDHGSVTMWIADLRTGEESVAQQELWDRYFKRIVALARMKLGNLPRSSADEEDVALSAMHSLFDGVAEDRFPRLLDRGNLWALLAKITARKAINQRQYENAQKRGGGKTPIPIGRVASTPGGSDSSNSGFDPEDEELGPEFLVAMEEELKKLMGMLPDEGLRKIAGRKLEGWTNAEIAKELGVVERTIERKLSLVRACWQPTTDE